MSVETAQGLSRERGQVEENENSASTPMEVEASFEALYLRYHARIVGVLFRLMGDRTRAEEFANDVFMKAYRRNLISNPGGNVGAWLYRTASNLGIDALRAAARRKRYEHAAGQVMSQAGAPVNPLDEVLRAETRSRVRTVLASLKPARARILILRSIGLSYNELAESLAIKRSSVGTMLTRAEAEFHRRYLRLDKEVL